MKTALSPQTLKLILKYQKDEITASTLYLYLAKKQKDENHRKVFQEMGKVEASHYETWKSYTGVTVKPDRLKITIFKILNMILGITFTIKYLEGNEALGIDNLNDILNEVPEAQRIIADEEDHENYLISLIDEERLQYIGAMVLGLNDALVELSGAIAGFTFALANTRLVALSAIITGVSATLSMAASNYLAERADGNGKAIKSAVYTGIAYLFTVVLMVLPYLLLPNQLYLTALIIMLTVVILIILFFTYYVSVTQSQPFLSRFLEMASISLGVAAISFGIGLLAKALLDIDI